MTKEKNTSHQLEKVGAISGLLSILFYFGAAVLLFIPETIGRLMGFTFPLLWIIGFMGLYSFLKSKRIVNGIPVILCYKKGNTSYFPDDSITGSLPNELHQFFLRCNKHLNNAVAQNPSKSL